MSPQNRAPAQRTQRASLVSLQNALVPEKSSSTAAAPQSMKSTSSSCVLGHAAAAAQAAGAKLAGNSMQQEADTFLHALGSNTPAALTTMQSCKVLAALLR